MDSAALGIKIMGFSSLRRLKKGKWLQADHSAGLTFVTCANLFNHVVCVTLEQGNFKKAFRLSKTDILPHNAGFCILLVNECQSVSACLRQRLKLRLGLTCYEIPLYQNFFLVCI